MTHRPGQPLIEFDCKLAGDTLLSAVFYVDPCADLQREAVKVGGEALQTFIGFLAENGYMLGASGKPLTAKDGN